MGKLNDLGVIYGTDKSSNYHNYLDWYEEVFNNRMTDSPEVVVEIGIKDGASLLMWRDYFPNSMVIGIDINASQMYYGVKTYQFDATNYHIWVNLFSSISHFGLVIEDSSHNTEDQLKIWDIINMYWFKEGESLFIMEDIHTSFIPHYVNSDQTTYDYLKQRNSRAPSVEFYQKDKDIFHDSMSAIIYR